MYDFGSDKEALTLNSHFGLFATSFARNPSNRRCRRGKCGLTVEVKIRTKKIVKSLWGETTWLVFSD